MAFTPPTLVKRTTKNARLSWAELDGDLQGLLDYINAVADAIAGIVQEDGTLPPNTIDDEVMIQDRTIGPRKLKLNFLPTAIDTGGAGNYAIAFTPALTAYEDNLVFFVRATNGNTGEATLNVNGLGAIALVKNGGQPLVTGDILPGQWFCAVYYGGSFHLLGAGASGAASGGGSGTIQTGLVEFDPAPVGLPGAGLTATFTHGLTQKPQDVRVRLVCTVAELGRSSGDEVSIDQFVDAGGNPAFSVKVNDAQIVVTQLGAVVKLADLTGGSVGVLTDITPENWNVNVTAFRAYTTALPMFPALDLQVSNPDGALGYTTILFFFQRGAHGGHTSINTLDLTTGRVNRLATVATMNSSNVAGFRLTGGKDTMVWCCDQGVFYLPLTDPTPLAWTQTEYGNLGDVSVFKPCWVDETAHIDRPVVYAVQSQSGAGATGSIGCRKLDTFANTNTAWGAPLNLHDTRITNYGEFVGWHGAGSSVLLFQYNPLKQRLYVITDETGFIHVFHVDNADFSAWWALADATRYSQLTYEKTLVLGGGAGHWANPTKDRFTVEYDFTSGAELSVAITRTDSAGFAGVITRVPWMEGE